MRVPDVARHVTAADGLTSNQSLQDTVVDVDELYSAAVKLAKLGRGGAS